MSFPSPGSKLFTSPVSRSKTRMTWLRPPSMGPSAAIRLPVASKATESTNPWNPRNSLKPDPATGRTSTLPDLVPVARNWPSGETANWDTCPAARRRRGKPLAVEGQISTPPLPADAAIHFPFGSNATSLGWSAATRRTEGQRRVAGQNVTPFRSSAVSHRPVGSNTAPIVASTRAAAEHHRFGVRRTCKIPHP